MVRPAGTLGRVVMVKLRSVACIYPASFLGAIDSRALMGSAHARLSTFAVSKTRAKDRLWACRLDRCCHHIHFTARNR